MTRRLLFVGVALALGVGAAPVLASHCTVQQTALRAPHSCCAPSAHAACAAACAHQNSRQSHDFRASTTDPTLKTFSSTIASHDLTVPVIMLASAGPSTEISPAPIPRRYLRICTLRL